MNESVTVVSSKLIFNLMNTEYRSHKMNFFFQLKLYFQDIYI